MKKVKLKFHVKAGDNVKILAGNYKNKTGKIIKVIPDKAKVMIANINMVFKHLKPSQENTQGRIIKKEAPIHISNVMLIDPVTNQCTRIGRKLNSQGKLQRYAKKTGEFIS